MREISESVERFNEKCKDVHLDFWTKYKYPVTIVSDRYHGAYSGGEFLAFPVHEWEVPYDHDGDDGTCMYFWNDVDSSFIGIGDTAQEALDNLCEKLKSKIDGH